MKDSKNRDRFISGQSKLSARTGDRQLAGAEQKQGYCERQEKRYTRMSKYSLDDDNKRMYSARAKAFGEKAELYEKLTRQPEKKAQFSKGFTDTRNIGEIISETDLLKFSEEVSSSGFSFMPLKKSQYGGFETYRGDMSVLDDLLKHLRENQKLLTELSGDSKIVLGYDYIGEDGTIDVGTFAYTKGRTIIFNKFMYDDSTFLAEEYANAIRQGKFAKGTTYLNIPDHECGHLFARCNKRYISSLRQACERRAIKAGITTDQYIIENISEYASYMDELPAEINAMKNGSVPDLALELLKEVSLK